MRKTFQDEEFPNGLILTTRQPTKIRNVFANNMSTDVKLSKAQIYKKIQLGGFLRNMFSNLGKNVMTDLAIALAKDNLPRLISNLAADTISKFEIKINGKGAVRRRKIFTLLYTIHFHV